MKPAKSILDSEFKYTPSTHTSVSETWKRHGWKPKESADPQTVHSNMVRAGQELDSLAKSAVSAPRVIPIKEIKWI